jgi:hypothetical protein
MKVKAKKPRMIRTQIQLTDEQAAGLKSLSAAKGGSMAEWIRRAVDGLLRDGGTPDRETLKRRALAAVGTGHSGIEDIAENHDAYLEDAYDPKDS